ncbi:hypothetical protein VTL71DRAFT_3186 [Oculimacula yallundae]|uniref:Uncharacterized protein n=1 Tax=Oculimacula yallundae TaxID=86028 RepID=A0ABR4C6G9_9HELO
MDGQNPAEMDTGPVQLFVDPAAISSSATGMAPETSNKVQPVGMSRLPGLNEDVDMDEQKENEDPMEGLVKTKVPNGVIVIDISSDDEIMVQPNQLGTGQNRMAPRPSTKKKSKKAKRRLLALQQEALQQANVNQSGSISGRTRSNYVTAPVGPQQPLPAAPSIRRVADRERIGANRDQQASLDAYKNVNAAGYRCYLPYAIQHSILSSIQNLLEECLFEFAKARVPDVLAAVGWTHHLTAELSLWWPVFKKVMAALPKQAIDHSQLDSPIENLFGRIRHIRHMVVHRLREVPMSSIEWMARDAASLALALGDNDRGSRLVDLYKRIQLVCKSADDTREPPPERLRKLEAGTEEIRSLEYQRAEIGRRLDQLRREQYAFQEEFDSRGEIPDALLGTLKDIDTFMVR